MFETCKIYFLHGNKRTSKSCSCDHCALFAHIYIAALTMVHRCKNTTVLVNEVL